MWQQKGLEVGYAFPFLFAKDCGLARNSRRPFVLARPSLSLSPCPLSCAGRKTRARAHMDLLFLAGLKPFSCFYILDEIPVALCQFITFARQMMSLDILRRGFIVVFYAGRTASVKRIRAERSRLIGYRAEICPPSLSSE